MESPFPRLTESGRRGWLIAATVLGAVGVAVSVARRDWVVALAIAAGLAVLHGVWWWARGGDEDDE